MAKAVASRWPDSYVNTVDPGWVPTKMGGAGAPDDLKKGFETQVWLAEGKEDNTRVTGQYFYHQKLANYNRAADNEEDQDKLLDICRQVTGIAFPDK